MAISDVKVVLLQDSLDMRIYTSLILGKENGISQDLKEKITSTNQCLALSKCLVNQFPVLNSK